MAAGQGFKTFVTGEVLTSGDVNGYLMQGINVFADATARDAAITAPAEGQFAFTKDNNSLWYYDGAAWVASGATGDIEGVTAGVGISGGGTSGTVTITNSMATAIDAKGDLVAGTAADTFDRLAVGANDTVLTADSSTATGLKWAAPASSQSYENYTLLNSGSTALSGAGSTYTLSSISDINKIMILGNGISSTSVSALFTVRINGSSTAGDYYQTGAAFEATSSYNSEVTLSSFGSITQTSIRIMDFQNGSANAAMPFSLSIDGGRTTGYKAFTGIGSNNGANSVGRITQGIYRGSAQITEVSLSISAGTFDAGNVYIYGSAV